MKINEDNMKKNKNIPELRFPEFWNSEEWRLESLENIAEVNPRPGKLPDTFIYIDLESVENGHLLQERIISQLSAPSRAQRLLQNEDILFQTVRPYQKNNLFF